MQFSDGTNKFGILQRATYLTFGDSASHIIDYPLADMTAAANEWVAKIATKIWHASRVWDFDDSNQIDLPVSTATLVNNQQDYSLPATALKVLRVEVEDSSALWSKLLPIDQSEIKYATAEFEKTAGVPQFYDIIGNSLFLYPKPDTTKVTAANGLKIFMVREATTFTVPATYTTADTTQPGFDEDFHDTVCYGIAHDWLRSNGEQAKANDYMSIINNMFVDVAQRYGQKNPDRKIAFKPRREQYS